MMLLHDYAPGKGRRVDRLRCPRYAGKSRNRCGGDGTVREIEEGSWVLEGGRGAGRERAGFGNPYQRWQAAMAACTTEARQPGGYRFAADSPRFYGVLGAPSPEARWLRLKRRRSRRG